MTHKREKRLIVPATELRSGDKLGRREFVATTGGILIASTGLVSACGSSGGDWLNPAKTPDPAHSTVSLSAASIQVSSTATLTLQAKDSTGANLTTGGSTVVFTATGGTATGTISATTDHGDGTYSAVYTATGAGTAQTIGATIDGTAVSTTLPTLAVTATAPVLDPTKCVVTATPATVAVSATAALKLQAKDTTGANITVGGATVVFSATGGTSTGTISATTDNGDGTYTATYTGTGAGTAQTIGAKINNVTVTTAMPTITVSASFATPDLLNNADFESGWDGMTNWSSGTPTGVDRSTVHAFSGSFAAHRTVPVTSGSDIGTQFIFTPSANQDHVFYRTYFYLTASMNGIMKFARWEGSSTGLGGLFLANGNLAWDFDVEVNAQFFPLVPISSLVNNWHWIEVDYWRNGDPSGFPSVAFWLDGNAITSSLNTPSPGNWSGGRLYAGQRNHSDKLIFCEWMATLNGSPPNTVAADLYVDRLAMSSQRIGP